jgi:hypothetical protein
MELNKHYNRNIKIQYLIKIIAIFSLIFLSLVCFYYSFNNATIAGGSIDLPFYSVELFIKKINPYMNIDQGVSPYAHAAYVLYSPLAIFKYESAKIFWASLNIFASIIIVILFSKFSKLTYLANVFISLIFFCSLPLRVSIGNGQTSILILLFYTAFFIRNKSLRTFVVGFSFVKYSFSIVTLFYFLIKYKLKYLLISSLVLVVGWLLFSFYLDENPTKTLSQPLKIAFSTFAFHLPRGDLHTVLNILNKHNLINNFNIINIFLCLCFGLFLSMNVAKISINNILQITSLLAIGNLLILPHIIYDYVLLLPSLYYSWKYKKTLSGLISIFVIFYFWFGIKIIYYINFYIFNSSEINPSPTELERIINFSLLLILFYFNFNMRKKYQMLQS